MSKKKQDEQKDIRIIRNKEQGKRRTGSTNGLGPLFEEDHRDAVQLGLCTHRLYLRIRHLVMRPVQVRLGIRDESSVLELGEKLLGTARNRTLVREGLQAALETHGKLKDGLRTWKVCGKKIFFLLRLVDVVLGPGLGCCNTQLLLLLLNVVVVAVECCGGGGGHSSNVDVAKQQVGKLVLGQLLLRVFNRCCGSQGKCGYVFSSDIYYGGI